MPRIGWPLSLNLTFISCFCIDWNICVKHIDHSTRNLSGTYLTHIRSTHLSWQRFLLLTWPHGHFGWDSEDIQKLPKHYLRLLYFFSPLNVLLNPIKLQNTPLTLRFRRSFFKSWNRTKNPRKLVIFLYFHNYCIGFLDLSLQSDQQHNNTPKVF